MKSAEIKELTVQELTERIDAEKANLAQMKVQHAGGTADSVLSAQSSLRPLLCQRTSCKFFPHLFYSPFFPSHTEASFLSGVA
mgnify:CR=1 FL=1